VPRKFPEIATDQSGGFDAVDLEAAEKPTFTPANTPTTADSLGMAIQDDDVGYIGIIQMGTPARDFKVLMDSGSADLWVGAEKCQSVAGGDCVSFTSDLFSRFINLLILTALKGNHVFLGPQSSSSFVDSQKPFNVTYGTGSVQGDIVADDVVIAGLSLPGHTFGVATRETEDFASDNTTFDGIMGLAQSTLSEQKTLTPVESLAQAGQIKDAIVSFKISRLAEGKNDGEATFGGLDTSKFDQNTLVTLENLSNEGFWEAGLDAVSVDGTNLNLNGRSAILDTGTTLMVLPAADAKVIHEAIPGAKEIDGTFTVPCTTNSSLALTFGKQPFAIDPRDLTFLPVDPNDLTGDCISGISVGQLGGADTWLVGDVFLKNAYFSTNVGKNSIQLAKLI
jgi:hypothetical protein